jgi:hypothetical protein
MGGTPVPKNSLGNAIKIYLFPALVTVLATLIWRDVTELRADVKQLLAESNSNKAKVEILEKQVQQLNQVVFKIPKTAGNVPQPTNDSKNTIPLYAVLNRDEYVVVKQFVPNKN